MHMSCLMEKMPEGCFQVVFGSNPGFERKNPLLAAIACDG
jgi:hypothetical protein